jgi:hypothetical protein
MPNDPIKGEGWAVTCIDDLGEGPGFRKVRQATFFCVGGAGGYVGRDGMRPEGAFDGPR